MTKFYYTIFNLIVLAAILYMGVDAFYKIIRTSLSQLNIETITPQSIPGGESQSGSQYNDFKIILDRNIFSSVKNETAEEKTPKTELLEPTSLKIALLGTVSGSEKNAAAIIEEKDIRKQGIYRVGDGIKNAIIKSIRRGEVVLKVGNRNEILVMAESDSSKRPDSPGLSPVPEPPAISAINTRTITIDRSSINREFEDINNLLSQATVRPHFQEGQPDGLAITGIDARSLFRRMGLRNGDIISGINNQPIQTPDDIISIYNYLTSGSQISLQIKRRGIERTINYIFRD